MLFKYFEKRTKDGFPDPNGPLSSHVPRTKVPVCQRRSIWGFAKYLLQAAESAAFEGKKHGPYER